MKYVSLEQVLKAHDVLLKEFGGSSGLRDPGLLEAAIARPRTTVFGKAAYPTLFDKAATLCHSLLFNHPFVDGNKRTALASCHTMLLLNGRDLTADSDEIYNFLIEVIKNKRDCPYISKWLSKHSRRISTR